MAPLCNAEDQAMLKFYYSGAPNPTKIALMLEEAGLPYEPIAGRHPQGRPAQAGISGDQSERQGAGDRRRRRHRVRFERHPALSRREDRQVHAGQDADKARGELLSWMMFVASGVGPVSRASRCISATTRRRRIDYAINRYAYEAQRHFGILDERLGKQQIHARRHLHDRRHERLGLGAADPERARRRRAGPNSRTSSAWSTRSARVRPPRRRSR